jgi:cytochrome c oxidase cbb3-type subunit IV
MNHLVSIETLRSLSTVLAFAAFIAVCVWAYSKKRHHDFEQAANLPFADEHLHRSGASAVADEEKHS